MILIPQVYYDEGVCDLLSSPEIRFIRRCFPLGYNAMMASLQVPGVPVYGCVTDV
jgi:hypothetical protein